MFSVVGTTTFPPRAANVSANSRPASLSSPQPSICACVMSIISSAPQTSAILTRIDMASLAAGVTSPSSMRRSFSVRWTGMFHPVDSCLNIS